MIKTIHKVVFTVAIGLWIAVIGILVFVAIHHQLWNLTPIIAHNKPQNYIGWMVIVAFWCSIASSILRLIADK